MPDNPYRTLPAVNDVLATAYFGPLTERHGRDAVVVAVRAELEDLRSRLKQGQTLNGDDTPRRCRGPSRGAPHEDSIARNSSRA